MSWCRKRYFWRLCPFSIDRKGQHFTQFRPKRTHFCPLPSLQKMSVNRELLRAWGFSPPPHTPWREFPGEGSAPVLKPFLGRRPRTISVQKAPSRTPGVYFKATSVNHSRSLWLLWKVVLSYQGPRQSSFVIQKWMEEACSHILGAETSLEAKRLSSPPLLSLCFCWLAPCDPHSVLEDCCFIPGDFSTLSPIAQPQLGCTPERGKPWRPVTSLWRLPSAPRQRHTCQPLRTECFHHRMWRVSLLSQFRHQLTLRPVPSVLPASPL